MIEEEEQRREVLELCAALTLASAVADIYQIYLDGDLRSTTKEKNFTVHLTTLLLVEYQVNTQVFEIGSFKAHAEFFI